MPRKPSKREIEAKIRKQFELACEELREQKYDADFRVHTNRDGSIDAELRIKPGKRQSIPNALIDLEQTVKPIPYTWVSSGLRFDAEGDEGLRELYIRHKGLAQAITHYRRNTGFGLADSLLTSRVKIDSAMKKRKRKKASEVIYRLHWNKDLKKPERK